MSPWGFFRFASNEKDWTEAKRQVTFGASNIRSRLILETR
ncbi:hypothetical protein J2Z84_001746 [Agrobacterium rubi]|nr:hypothetical protein [Agrobacterium rubi]